MKKLLLILMLAGPAGAQEITCPERLDNARLLGAGMYHGHNKEYELMGLRQPVPGGENVHYGFGPTDVKWLVCAYEGRKEWWQRIESRATDCILRQRNSDRRVSVRLRCR